MWDTEQAEAIIRDLSVGLKEEDKEYFSGLFRIFSHRSKFDAFWQIPVARRLAELPDWKTFTTIKNIDSMKDTFLILKKHSSSVNCRDPEVETIVSLITIFVAKYCPENIDLLLESNY